jgi:hypothetical protein
MRRLTGPAAPPAVTATALTAVALVMSLAGCGQVDARLSRQSADVTFRQGTRPALIAVIAKQCHHISGIEISEARGRGDRVTGISLQAGPAGVFSRRQLADMYSCLGDFPAVTGVSVQEVDP